MSPWCLKCHLYTKLYFELNECRVCCVLCWFRRIFCPTVSMMDHDMTHRGVTCHILLSTALLDLMNIQYFYSYCITLHILRKCERVLLSPVLSSCEPSTQGAFLSLVRVSLNPLCGCCRDVFYHWWVEWTSFPRIIYCSSMMLAVIIS